jgi:hypothetical protein
MVQEKAGRYARPTHTEWLSLTHRYRQSQLRRLALIFAFLDAEPMDAAESVARDLQEGSAAHLLLDIHKRNQCCKCSDFATSR